MKSVPGSICINILAVLLMSECENVWSFADATSISSIAAIKFSPRTALIPDGTAPVIPIQLTAPFCNP